MSFKTFEKPSLSPKYLSVKYTVNFLYFLGTALLLYAHLELWIIPLGMVLAIFPSLVSIQKSSTNLVAHVLLHLTLAIILLLPYYFILLRYLRPPIGESIKIFALICFILSMFLFILYYSITKIINWFFFLKSALFFISLLLWKLRIVHRKELVWLFVAESVVFLIAGIHGFYLLITKKQSEKTQLPEDGASAEADISAAIKKSDSDLGDVAVRQLEAGIPTKFRKTN